MASIKISSGADGKPRYYITWQLTGSGHGRRRIFKNPDEAAHFLWKIECELLGHRRAREFESSRSWSLTKLIYFFLGAQFDKLERNVIRLSTYTKCRYDLQAVRGDILAMNVQDVSHYELTASLNSGALRWVRSAFYLLIKMRVITTTPLNKSVRYRRKPILPPAKSTIKKLLTEAPRREQIACWLGAVCGLRIGEALALTYADISEKWISVHKRITDHGVEEGLKAGEQRRVGMPRALYALLDPDKLGTNQPVIANNRTGDRMGIKYASQGILKQVLTRYGIKKYHHLRHFAVSRLADHGVDILKVSRMIGHKDFRMTMNIYGHLFGETIDLNFD